MAVVAAPETRIHIFVFVTCSAKSIATATEAMLEAVMTAKCSLYIVLVLVRRNSDWVPDPSSIITVKSRKSGSP